MHTLLGIQPVPSGEVMWPELGFVFEAPDVCWKLMPDSLGNPGIGFRAKNITPKPREAVNEVMWKLFPEVSDAFREYEELVSRPMFHNADQFRMSELESLLVENDGWGKEKQWKAWLSLLGLDGVPDERWIEQLRTEERGKVGLARMLGWLNETNRASMFLLMLEPERILSPDALERMGEYLVGFEGAMIVATVDPSWLRKAGISWRWLDCEDGRLHATDC